MAMRESLLSGLMFVLEVIRVQMPGNVYAKLDSTRNRGGFATKKRPHLAKDVVNSE
jgi:hypothetical protein